MQTLINLKNILSTSLFSILLWCGFASPSIPSVAGAVYTSPLFLLVALFVLYIPQLYTPVPQVHHHSVVIVNYPSHQLLSTVILHLNFCKLRVSVLLWFKICFNLYIFSNLYRFLVCFFYLAVSSSDHVYVVANQLECEASVHESKATLQRDRDRRSDPTSASKSVRERDHLTQMEASIGNNCEKKQFFFVDCLHSLY